MAPSQDCGTDRSRSSSPSMCSTRVSTSPPINTVLFLRPTESSTVFLQQLGRGLRRAKDKAVLTALDFVGHHRKEFRFDQRFRAMTGSTRAAARARHRARLPVPARRNEIVLDRQSQKLVLENIRSQVAKRWTTSPPSCALTPTRRPGHFPRESGVELPDVVRGDRSWARLRREAGLAVAQGGDLESALSNAFAPSPTSTTRARGGLPAVAGDDAPLRRRGSGSSSLWAHAVLLPVARRRWLRFVCRRAGRASRGTRRARRPARGHCARPGRAERVSASTWPVSSVFDPCGCTPVTPERNSSPPSTTWQSDGRKPNSFREGVLFVARSQCRRLPCDSAQVRGRLLPHDDVPGLCHQSRALPLGVAVGHHRRVQDWSALPQPPRAGQPRAAVHATAEGTRLRVRRAVPLPRGGRLRRAPGERPIAITWRLRTPMPAADFATASVVA